MPNPWPSFSLWAALQSATAQLAAAVTIVLCHPPSSGHTQLAGGEVIAGPWQAYRGDEGAQFSWCVQPDEGNVIVEGMGIKQRMNGDLQRERRMELHNTQHWGM